MAIQFFNALPNFSSKNVNVDRENGVLKNCCVAEFGDNKNGTFFDDVFLNTLVSLGNAGKGVKSRFGHPNMCSTAPATFIGRYRNFSTGTNDAGKSCVFADLHLDETCKKSPDGDLYNYVLDMAEKNPDMFGNSVHIFGEIVEEEINGELKRVHKIELFKACDLVDDPAATSSLFSNKKDLGIQLTEFFDSNPELFDTIDNHPEMISDFFDRYINYSQRKTNNNFDMSKLQALKDRLFGKTKTFALDVTTGDGAIVKVETESETPQVGDAITNEDGSAIEDNTEIVLPDGSKYIVVGGMIDSIVDAPAPDPANPDATLMAIGNLTKKVETMLSQFSTFKKETEDVQELFATKMEALGKQIHSTYKGPKNPDQKFGNQGSADDVYDADKAKEIRENAKK